MIAFWVVVGIAIICATFLCSIYMYYCSEEGINMFEDHSIYKRRLEYLEEQVQKLMEDNR